MCPLPATAKRCSVEEQMLLQLKPNTCPQFHFGVSPGKVFLLIVAHAEDPVSFFNPRGKKTQPFSEVFSAKEGVWKFQITSAGKWSVRVGSVCSLHVLVEPSKNKDYYDITFDAREATSALVGVERGVSQVLGVKLSSLTQKEIKSPTPLTVWERLSE